VSAFVGFDPPFDLTNREIFISGQSVIPMLERPGPDLHSPTCNDRILKLFDSFGPNSKSYRAEIVVP
jgi:hypothetical protein